MITIGTRNPNPMGPVTGGLPKADGSGKGVVVMYSPGVPGDYTVIVQGQITDQSSSQRIDYQGRASAAVTVTAQ